jgi:two-component system NtrC family sensor kinase
MYDSIIAVMLVLSLSPLFLLSGLLFQQYDYILERETEQQLRWNTEIAKHNLESYIEQIKYLLKFAIKEYSIEELLDQEKAEKLFYNLKADYKGFVDFEVIDSSGIQKVYVGPFDLKDINYSDADWFKKSSIGNENISAFFKGYRKIPHFVLTLTKYSKDYKINVVIRASIDMQTLENVLYSVSTTACDDIFLVDNTKTLHTTSIIFGDIENEVSLNIYPYSSIMMFDKAVYDDTYLIYTVMPIKDTPWRVVLVKRGLLISKNWVKLKEEVVFTVFLMSACVLVISFVVAQKLIWKFRESEESKESALMAAQQAGKLASIGRLAAGVAHEINNPLAIIDQKAGLMQDLMEFTGDFEQKGKFDLQIKGIRDAVQRCKSITHRLLGFARRMDISLDEIDISSVINDVISFIDKEALYRQIKIETEFSEAVPRIFSDRGQLQQVFLNIINNALDAVVENGLVNIKTLKKNDDFIDVIIQDSGHGIPPYIIKNIFEPFFTTKEPGKGTGLGLSITYGIVKKLGGEITVESEIGKGAQFTITLPVKPQQAT